MVAILLIEVFEFLVCITRSTCCIGELTSFAIVNTLFALIYCRILDISVWTISQAFVFMKIQQVTHTTLSALISIV